MGEMKVLFVDPDPHARTEAVGAVLARRGHVMTAAHDATALIVHLVTRPTALTRPRDITFGLMATPAKPMPAA